MTTLMVTPYPPYRDGIGTYAVQEIRRMRAEGIDVEVLSPVPSAAHHHLALGNTRGVLALVKRVRGRRYETVVIQFSPEMMFGACRGPLERVAVWAGLEALARVTRLEIRLHEIEFGPLRRNPAERAAAGRALRAAASVTVHTRPEIANLASVLQIDSDQVTLVEHGQHFAMATEATQAEARSELGIEPDHHVFLAIGFLQEHKGFDVAVEAFGRATLAPQAAIHVVGSVRVDHPDLVAYARRLEQQCRATPGASLHRKYVSDEEFDRWIVAADTVVLPYREIWSSSVLERAKLYDRTIIAADVGGMGDQAPPGTLFFDGVETLVQVMKERAQTTLERSSDGDERPARPAPELDITSGWSVDSERPDRMEIEAQVRTRARAGRLLPAGGGRAAPSDAIDPLLSVGPVQRPHAVSARPGVSALKRLIRRVTNWEIDPIVAKVEALHHATTQAVDQLDSRIATSSGTDAAELVIEEPFVHAALADLSFGTTVLLSDGGRSRLDRAVDAAGHVVTPIMGSPTIAERSGPFDVIVATSAGLEAVIGPDRSLDACRKLLAETGRIVLAIPYQRAAERGPARPFDQFELAELLRDWTVRYVSVGLRSSETSLWRLEADELVAPSEQERLVLLVATP